ncbi:trans-aconitate 2-methyltransferase [Myxosarcina sp. GI1]|uniref:class I SAM-dependent methyltransferase n=1 Tax=Myxosarcina sp. GI1 TaxID=1541065 RepID=UPI00055C6B18|nr:class I SAM-dependent methyltransferase [Myxosarcina sp. GI1]
MNRWNTELYEEKHSFVWQYGQKVLQLLAPQPNERILDLGCGTGQLTAEIAATGAEVVGIDSSEQAIATAKKNFPHIEFLVADGANFFFDKTFDAVFSNAALHWIQPPAKAIECIWRSLKPKGRLVAEFGGKGNIAAIVTALNSVLETPYNPWYFPSIAEYSNLLERQGFEVVYATLRDRPTKLEGEKGLANWLEMFAGSHLETYSETKDQIIAQTETRLKPLLYRDDNWIADYRRICIVAIKKQQYL